MSSNVRVFKDNTAPSIVDQIRVNNRAYDLTSATVRFKMRLDTPTASGLKVDRAASITVATEGRVQFDWDPDDTDTAGEYLAWWEVTEASGDIQDTQEFQVRIEEHVDVSQEYLTLAELKASLTPDATSSFDADDMQRALSAGSRSVDFICRRRFWLDPTAVDRYYTPTSDIVQIDDLSNAVDPVVTVDDVELVNGTDYLLEPLNAAADGLPWEQIRLLVDFTGDPASLKVNGKFGWLVVPPGVASSTSIIAGRLLLRMRQAPLGFQLTEVNAIRIGSDDPDIARNLSSLMRARMLKSLPLA